MVFFLGFNWGFVLAFDGTGIGFNVGIELCCSS
jgi:hypothetical protein